MYHSITILLIVQVHFAVSKLSNSLDAGCLGKASLCVSQISYKKTTQSALIDALKH